MPPLTSKEVNDSSLHVVVAVFGGGSRNAERKQPNLRQPNEWVGTKRCPGVRRPMLPESLLAYKTCTYLMYSIV